MRQNTFAPSIDRKQPDTFCWTLIIRKSFSAWLLVLRQQEHEATLSENSGRTRKQPEIAGLVRLQHQWRSFV
jgi:hypothetical protein